MPALNHDILIEQGATFQREFTVTDSAGVAFSLAGYTVRGKIRDNAGTDAVSFTVTATSNKLLIELTAVQTAALPASTSFTHKYDVEAESGGVVYRIAQGNVLISAEQTK
jgi:hypothetical protein